MREKIKEKISQIQEELLDIDRDKYSKNIEEVSRELNTLIADRDAVERLYSDKQTELHSYQNLLSTWDRIVREFGEDNEEDKPETGETEEGEEQQ